ncbi:MAG: putative C-S lyase, partial [Chloroflexi bacterium]|nr:putative C-S lyase [Chloroflexota bacterium]
IPNADLRRRVKHNAIGLHINAMGLAAVEAAYTECDDWLAELRQYLSANRDTLVDYVAENFSDVSITVPEATYLAWMDFRKMHVPSSPFEFFLHHAKVALNDGATFGTGGSGFARFNYGCPRAQMMQALEQMRAAIVSHHPRATNQDEVIA